MVSVRPVHAYILIAAGLALIILSLATLAGAAGVRQQGGAFAVILIGPIPLFISGDSQLALAVMGGALALIILFLLMLLRRLHGG